ncbi:unnamed protein product, partial [Rotaria magnacalcarata]
MENTTRDDPFLSHFETLVDESQINNKSSKNKLDLFSSSLGSCQFSSTSSDNQSPILPCPVSTTIDSFA